ncbi:hypothetical protein C2S52_005567 [Perilla frutescens var. hirtella]|nr:hypothetical protein C2S52_005567 [Perilla frutescens var. hirtella]
MEETPMSAVSNIRGVAGSSIQVILLHGQPISTKLDDSNYLLWKQQVMATISGYDLEGFLTGDNSAPEQLISSTSDGGDLVNPDYTAWTR